MTIDTVACLRQTALRLCLHYIGSSSRLELRELEHRHGHGARLLAAADAAGIGWQVARLWPARRINGGWCLEEFALKWRRETPKLCPCCNPNANLRAVELTPPWSLAEFKRRLAAEQARNASKRQRYLTLQGVA